MDTQTRELPKIYLVAPCYNEADLLPHMKDYFKQGLSTLIDSQQVSPDSRIVFVNDGSKDATWDIISQFAQEEELFEGINLSRNFGQQGALLAGLMSLKDKCDCIVTMDCDGQDDISVMGDMIASYKMGSDIVYGVRSDRSTDTFFKRNTAVLFYRFMKLLGSSALQNHADFRLVSTRALNELARYQEVNLFLRGIVPLLGFRTDIVYYERNVRVAGESSYPLRAMIKFALEGITSCSVKPLRLIGMIGFIISILSVIGIIWAIVVAFSGRSYAGWSSLVAIICLMGGIQLVSLGIVGEYVGRIYLETKARPRFCIMETTQDLHLDQ